MVIGLIGWKINVEMFFVKGKLFIQSLFTLREIINNTTRWNEMQQTLSLLGNQAQIVVQRKLMTE